MSDETSEVRVTHALGLERQDAGVDPEEIRRETLKANEDAVLRAIFTAHDPKKIPVGRCDVPRIPVPDPEQPGHTRPLSFRVRGVKQATLEAATRQATERKRDDDLPGFQMRDVVNNTRMQADVIYRATVSEDRAWLWDSQQIRQHCNVGTGPELVAELLLAGELGRCFLTIMELSGFAGGASHAVTDRDAVRD